MVAPRVGYVPAKVVRQVTPAGDFLPHQEYLQCEDPLTWSLDPLEAQVMDYAEADKLARVIQAAGEQWVFPAVARVDKAEPPKPPGFFSRAHSRESAAHWRDRSANCGIE